MQWLAILALFLQGYVVAAWPRALNVTRYFHATDKGQLHYVTGGGDLASGVPLVMLHSDPRSGVEFKYLLSELSRPFIAVDFYGMGASEECKCEDDEFVKFTDYAASVYEILQKHGVKKFVPVGNLKGTNPALALADLAGWEKVSHVIQISPLMLPPAAIGYMVKKFIPSILHPEIDQDGTHLLNVWKDPSAGPFGPDGKPDNVTGDLMVNEEKTIDFLRCRNNGARPRNQKAWVDYNDKIPAAVERVSRYAHFLFVYASHITDNYVKYGMHPEWSKAQLSAALYGGLSYTNVTLENANEGLLFQNSTVMAGHIERFLESQPTELV